jgi:RimJ/RimL family protein N-acetyltransferase
VTDAGRRPENMPGAQFRSAVLAGRLAVPADITDLSRLLNHPLMTPSLGGGRGVDSIAASISKSRRHWLRHGWGVWVFHDPSTGDFLGRGGLAEADVMDSREVEVVCAIHPDFQGRGFGTAVGQVAVDHARRHLDVGSLVACTSEDDVASLRVVDKLGFRHESAYESAGRRVLVHRLALR